MPVLATSDAGKIVVTEFFSYQCPHCFKFEKPFADWSSRLAADVKVERAAVAIGHANWQPASENVPERLDRLAHQCIALAVVSFPYCFTKLFVNHYLNSACSVRYSDYIFDYIVPLL